MHTDHENLASPVFVGVDPRDTYEDHARRAGEQWTGKPYVYPGARLPANVVAARRKEPHV